jgi:hypothetical protein
MADTDIDGPLLVYGDTGNLYNQPSGVAAFLDPNASRGPSMFFQSTTFQDLRVFFQKDRAAGSYGITPSNFHAPSFYSADTIPTALASNNIAAAQAVANGVAMTLAGSSLGVTPNVPIVPWSTAYNDAPVVTAALALEFGFAFGTTIAGNTTITVNNSVQFPTGMPLVIGNAGNAAGTIPLLTIVTGAPTATTITVQNAPLASATVPIGTGNIWGPSTAGFPTPVAAAPYVAAGSQALFDPQQALCRGVRITGTSGATGGNFLVSGWDVYGQPMTQLVTVAAGASTGYTKKTFKYIASVVPQFTDASHNYTVGNSDVFGFGLRSDEWEYTAVFWAGTPMPSATGWLAGDQTNPATNLTGDVRGTVQVSSTGGGSGISGGAASNGALTGVVLTGNRFVMAQDTPMFNMIRAIPATPTTLYGQFQA